MVDKIHKIIDNQRVTLLDVFKNLSRNHKTLSIATGYWDLKVMAELKEEIKNFTKVRLLIGREPLIPRHSLITPENSFPTDDFKFDLQNLVQNSELRKTAEETLKLIENGILEVKVFQGNFLHAKTYIFGDFDSENAVGIIGSSNFTYNGLLANTELNHLENDIHTVLFRPNNEKQANGHLSWFEEYWNNPNSKLWNKNFSEIISLSPIGNLNYSPYEMYIKTLFELFKEEIEELDEISKSKEFDQKLFDFQIKNSKSLLRKLNKFGVAMLSDSVGLGKTSTSIEVIKNYLNGENGKQRVEIIVPKSIIPQWEKELLINGIIGCRPISLQNLSEIEAKMNLDSIASVSLFVIDESHNLRSSTGTRFKMLLDWIRSNPNCHVLLVTATPINNNLNDLSTQILLGTGGRGDALKFTITSEDKQTEQINFYQAIENLNKKIGQDLTRSNIIDFDAIKQTMTPIIRNFVVRRTRQGIMSEYKNLIIDEKETAFPQVIPEVLKYSFSDNIFKKFNKLDSTILNLDHIVGVDPEIITKTSDILQHPLDSILNQSSLKNSNTNSISAIFQLILTLGFIPYRWKIYQREYYKKNKSQLKEIIKFDSVESKKLLQQLSIYGILRTVFLKRMESSVSALKVSLKTYETKLDLFEKGIERGEIHSISDLDSLRNSLDDDESIDYDEAEIQTTLQTRVTEKNYHITEIKEDIKKEKEILRFINHYLNLLEEDDSKLNALIDLVKDIQKNKPGSKILVFSYFADTIEYIEKKIFEFKTFFNQENTEFVSSRSKNRVETIASRFSPVAKKYSFKNDEKEIQFLFSTDVLSEGQNLQDCGILINYDLHWNPVRMIQRNGRINRLGSEFEEIFIYNMKPETQLDLYLKLIQRLQGKIDLIRNTIGTDTPVLEEPENPIEFSDSLKDIYSDDLNTRLKAVSDAERSADLLFSEDEFVYDLKRFYLDKDFSDSYKKEIFDIPQTKWGEFPNTKNLNIERPDLLGFVKLFSKETNSQAFQFIEIDPKNEKIKFVNHLHALEILRTTKEDNMRSLDRISLDKSRIVDILLENSNSLENIVSGSLIGQEIEILRLMANLNYDENDIKLVRNAFQTNDIFYKRDMASLKKKIISENRRKSNYQNLIDDIVKLAAKINLNEDKKESEKLSESSVILVFKKK